MKKILAIFSFLFILIAAQSQVTNKGKLFWVTFPEVATFNSTTVDSFVLYMSSDVATTAEIELYGLGSKKTVKVKPGVLTSYNLSVWNSDLFLFNKKTGIAEIKRALRITSDDPITLYAMAMEDYKSDGSFVMPYEAIPNNPTFIVGTYFPNVGGSSSLSPSEFSIVAMDRITLRIKPAADTRDGETKGVPFTITLNKGQVYQLQSKADQGHRSSNLPSGNVSGDLSGTIISVVGRYCGKYNVFSGNLETSVPYRGCQSGFGGTSSDYLYSQNFPTSVLGKEYVFTPFSTHSKGYVFRVIATQKNTKVWVDGVLATTLSDTGDVYTEDVGTAVAKHITSDKPIYALEFMKTDRCAGNSVKGDPAILATPTVEQMITKATIGAPRTGRIDQFFLNIIVRATAKSAVLLDGVSIPASNFTNIGTSGFAYTQQSIQSKSYNVRCDSGMIAITYGIGDYESYAYCAGATFENLNYDIGISKTGRCPNTNINFEALLQNAYQSIDWDYGDGSKDTGKNVTHAYKESGVYTVTMNVKQNLGCGSLDSNIRSKTIVVDGAKPGFPDTTRICGTAIDFTLDATYSKNYEYLWHDASTKQTFNVTDTGKFKVTVYDTLSKCAVADSTIVVQYDTLLARIGYDTLKPCLNINRFALSDISTYTNDAFGSANWRVVNEDSDTIVYTTKKIGMSFTKVGTYPIFYEVTSAKGCKAKDTVILNVYDLPKANFTVDDTIKCARTDFQFDDASTDVGGIFTSIWDWGDGTKDTGLSVLHDYMMHDTFKVTMQAVNFYGCRDTIDTMVIAKPLPKPEIEHKSNNYCLLTHDLVFSDSTKDISGGWTSDWYKNGTYLTTGSNTGSVKFSDSGLHTIRLIALNNYNCKDSVDYQVKVFREPTAIIGITDSSNCVNSNFFDIESNSTASPGENFTYKWTLSDGTNYNVSKFKKSFGTVGSKNLKLVVTTNNKCKDSTERTVVVDSMPDGRFTTGGTLTCFPNHQFSFETANNYSGAVSYNWNAGDGTFYDVPKPVHSYTDTGSYTVQLIFTNGPGCKDTQQVGVRVVGKSDASFTSNIDSFCYGSNTFTFVHSPFVLDYSVAWDFGDGTNTTTTNPTKSYSGPGNYNVKLVTNKEGVCFDSTSKTVKVFGVPQARFTVNDSTQCEDANSFVIGNATVANSATGLQYNWNLTPGGIFNTINIGPLVLPSVAKYDLSLRVVSDRGCETITSNSLELFANPIVSITGEDQCIGELVTFTENVTLSQGTITSYRWNFGEGPVGTVIPASHTYNTAGTYNVVLTITSDQNCIGVSNTTQVTIHPRPKANFTGTYVLSRGNESDYEFVSTSSGANRYRWTYNKLPDVDITANVNKTFFDTGNLVVQLRVNNAQGCADSISSKYLLKPQLLYHVPNAFSPNGNRGNELFRGSSDYGMEDYLMTIYDRWGGTIFRTDNPSTYWDGTDKSGNAVQDGAYIYFITFIYFDGTFHRFKGALHVIR